MHAEDVIAGARVYGLLPEDRPAVCKLSLSSLAATVNLAIFDSSVGGNGHPH